MSESRKAFENQYDSDYLGRDEDGYYKWMSTQEEWELWDSAWQAAREGVEGEPVAVVDRVGIMQRLSPYTNLPEGTKLYTHPAIRQEGEPICFLQSSGVSQLSGGHPAKLYPIGATPSPFESSTLLYTHPARDGQDSVAVVNKASTGEYEFYPSSNLVDIPNGIYKLYTYPASRQAVSVPDAWCVVTNDDQIQYTAMVDKNLGLPIEQSHDYAWQQCNEVIQEWIELGLDAASKYVIRPIAFEERVAELECMVRAFRACVDLQMVPSWGSPCHDQIHALVGESMEDDQ